MLTRCLVVTVGSLGILAGVQQYCRPAPAVRHITPVKLDASNASESQCRQWQDLEERGQRRDQFARFQAEIVQRLARQEVSLRAAVDRTLYYCLNRYPEHLENITLAEPGATLPLKIGQNILRAFHNAREWDNGKDYGPLLARLERELGELSASCTTGERGLLSPCNVAAPGR